jgi:hypothetical protein
MRPFALLAVGIALLGTALPATAASPGRRLNCGRLERRLAALEARAVAVCGEPVGCRERQITRIARVADRYADGCVRLNQVQVLASHNSYHVQPRPALYAALLAVTSFFQTIGYTHGPLDDQFERLGIRAIELDVFGDPEGGLFGIRSGLAVVGEDPLGPFELFQPGLKVLHIQDIDFESRCLTFVSCLSTVKTWSDAHPGHLPLMIQIEAKDDVIPDAFGVHFAVPVPFDAVQFDTVDTEIRSIFPADQLITPDDVRGARATLEEAVLADGWPTLGEARGRILFTLDNGGAKRATYRAGRPSLEGRVLFTDGTPGQPDAAFVKRNDPSNPIAIAELVAAGYIVRTRADADTLQARSGDTMDREAALASGAQYVSTDYPEPNPEFGTGYMVAIPGGMPGRCNPVNGPAGCRERTLER